MIRIATIVERSAFVIGLSLLSEPAWAYIDPGTGAAVTTAILGLLGSIAYTTRKYIYRIKDVFTGKPRGGDAGREETPDDR